MASEAHHVFPVQFEEALAAAGFRGHMTIHNPLFGAWVDASVHRRFSHKYNEEWALFFSTDRGPEEVLTFGRQLAERYGFKVMF